MGGSFGAAQARSRAHGLAKRPWRENEDGKELSGGTVMPWGNERAVIVGSSGFSDAAESAPRR
jgi:hypothetical protein